LRLPTAVFDEAAGFALAGGLDLDFVFAITLQF
jgi:hypothetical protein